MIHHITWKSTKTLKPFEFPSTLSLPLWFLILQIQTVFDANSDSDSNASIHYCTTVNSLLRSFYFRFSSFLHFHFKHCSISLDIDSLIRIFMILSEMEFNSVESVCDMNMSFSCLIQICNVIIGYRIGIRMRIVEVVELWFFFSFRSLNWILHCKKQKRLWFLLSNWRGYDLLEDTSILGSNCF